MWTCLDVCQSSWEQSLPVANTEATRRGIASFRAWFECEIISGSVVNAGVSHLIDHHLLPNMHIPKL